MSKYRNITVMEKLAGLAVAILVVGGLSSVTGSFLNRSDDHLEREFVAFDVDPAPLVRVDAAEDVDVVFQPREFMDERTAEALEEARKVDHVQLTMQLIGHKARLETLVEMEKELQKIRKIPEPLRLEMQTEIDLEMQRVKQEVLRVVADTSRVHAIIVAATRDARIEDIAEAAREPLPRALPLPPLSPDVQACEEPKKKPAKEKGSKDGREGFIEALSFV